MAGISKTNVARLLDKAKIKYELVPYVVDENDNLNEWFPEHCLDRIYLNFSDPWPKKGHAKRRLTHRGFLEIYKNLLKDDGILRLKTDNVGLFDFSLEEFAACGLTVEWLSRDLHASEIAADNVMTEYERNFSLQGMPIYRLVARKHPPKAEQKPEEIAE